MSEEQEAQLRRAKVQAEQTARIAHKAIAFRRLFIEHPDGAYVLLCLKQEFMPSIIFDKDPMTLAANAQARDIIDYIERMMRFKEVQPHVAETEILPERG